MISCVPDLSPRLRAKYGRQRLLRRRYRFLTAEVAVVSNAPRVLSLFDRIFSSFRSRSVGKNPVRLFLIREKDRYLVADPGFSSFICSDPSQAVSFSAAQLMVNHLYRLGVLLFHGAALARKNLACVFVGGSRSGKTTLALKLARAGWTLFSDELVPFDPAAGSVYPFPRAFLFREETLALVPRLRPDSLPPFLHDYQESAPDSAPVRRFIVSPGKMVPRLGKAARKLGAVFVLSGFSRKSTRIQPLPAAPALPLLLEHCLNPGYVFGEGRERALEALVSVLQRAPAFAVFPGPLGEPPRALGSAIARAVRLGRPIGCADLSRVARRCKEIMKRPSGLTSQIENKGQYSPWKGVR